MIVIPFHNSFTFISQLSQVKSHIFTIFHAVPRKIELFYSRKNIDDHLQIQPFGTYR